MLDVGDLILYEYKTLANPYPIFSKKDLVIFLNQNIVFSRTRGMLKTNIKFILGQNATVIIT